MKHVFLWINKAKELFKTIFTKSKYQVDKCHYFRGLVHLHNVDIR